MPIRVDYYDPALKDLDDDPELFDYVPGDNGNMTDSVNIVDTLIARRDTEFTPDFDELKTEDFHLLFVYGTLKCGGRLTHLLDGCPYLGEGYLLANNYNLLSTTREGAADGGFPVLKWVGHDHHMSGKVAGEIYVVDSVRLLGLDRVERNGEMYRRGKYWVKPYEQARIQGKSMQVIKCWTYVGIDAFWKNHRLWQLEPEYHATQLNDQIKMHNFDVRQKRAA